MWSSSQAMRHFQSHGQRCTRGYEVAMAATFPGSSCRTVRRKFATALWLQEGLRIAGHREMTLGCWSLCELKHGEEKTSTMSREVILHVVTPFRSSYTLMRRQNADHRRLAMCVTFEGGKGGVEKKGQTIKSKTKRGKRMSSVKMRTRRKRRIRRAGKECGCR